jgi:SOS-response transcriptional repressor LexA
MSWAATAADTGQAQEALNVESFLIERPDQTAYCRVKGDSKMEAGMLDGDIVVDVVDRVVTIKRLRGNESPGSCLLEPDNAAFQPIHPKGSLKILDVVTGSFRRFFR